VDATAIVRDIPIHYEEHGEGRAVMLLHGFGIDHRFMTQVHEATFAGRQGWRRIYPDMPGHGPTPGPEWLATEDQMLEVLVGFADAVAGGERLVLIGSSWGAYLALGLMNDRPDAIDGLMLTVPVVHAEHARRDAPPHTVLVNEPAAVADLQPGEEAWLELAVVRTRERLAAFRTAIPPGLATADAPFLERLQTTSYAFSFEDELTATIGAPALIVAGRQDSVVGYRDAWPLLGHLPRATFVILDRAGHLLEDEQPTLLRALAEEWLDRVEEYIAR
jgi:pimeloyl-ACP methyl ester carboxylesterase